MKPLAVFQFAQGDGPGRFGEYLDRQGIAWQFIALDEGAAVPADAGAYAGLAFMGGPMSANDPLAWNAPVLALMRDAVRRRVPVIGHCLGGQLLSRALGGAVTRNPVKEIGWCEVRAEANPEAQDWLGASGRAYRVFQWHGETFSIPPGGTRILTGAHCANQAYVVDGLHLGMQCHVEMTPDLIAAWCATGGGEVAAASASPAVSPIEAIRQETPERLTALTALAHRLYDRWSQGLR
jgi:GMP synthase-like glutamine amidotransferase